MDHHVEAFLDDQFVQVWGQDASGWGWQCFDCGAEQGGYGSLLAAEKAGEEHAKEAQ